MQQVPSQDPNTRLIDMRQVSDRFDDQSSYSNNKRACRIYQKYLNNELNISSFLHHKIYGEHIDDNPRALTPCVRQHLYIVHYPAGGLNTNDYPHLPLQFRREFYNMVKDHLHPNNMGQQLALINNLTSNYKLPDKMADVISWYWSGSEDKYGYLHKKIVDDGWQ
jgi:hypothetical protein